jgi:hypothetical protein
VRWEIVGKKRIMPIKAKNGTTFNLLDLIKCNYHHSEDGKYIIIEATPATGILYVTKQTPYFISGHVRLRGRDDGRYPYNYLEMIDRIFGPGPEKNTIEVCSRDVKGKKFTSDNPFTVDINPDMDPDLVDDAQLLSKIKVEEDNIFDRWRCDPPYNKATAKSMYGTDLPETSKLLSAGARVCRPGALLFLLLGPQNYQWIPAGSGLRRIGWIAITVVPNNELRALHIFYKKYR